MYDKDYYTYNLLKNIMSEASDALYKLGSYKPSAQNKADLQYRLNKIKEEAEKAHNHITNNFVF